jgi:hypothetical protein
MPKPFSDFWILPGTGRGTMRSMVEGYGQSGAAYDLLYPSTTLRVVPLPRWGRIAERGKRHA